MIQILLFEAGGGRFGLDLSLVQTIRKMEEPSAGHPPAVPLAGLLGLSGGGGRNNPDQAATLVLSEGDLALRVDRIGGVATAHEGEFSPLPPVFGEKARRFCPRILTDDAGALLMLDPAVVAEAAAEGASSPGEVSDRSPEAAPPPADVAAEALEARLFRRITSEEMAGQVEALIRRLSQEAAVRGVRRIRRILKGKAPGSGGGGHP